MSKFQRRHYEAIAEVLGQDCGLNPDEYICNRFVTMFERDNPAFNATAFRSRVRQWLNGIIMR